MEKATVLERYTEYRMDIGIEVHVQLNTKSKIFCSCPNVITQTPNKNICPVCAGYPGVLPVLNEEVVQSAIKAGIGTHCTIAEVSEFDRKHYFYPDLPKNYQITQNDRPICEWGYVMIRKEDGTEKKVRIRRIHIEEDAGKNMHSDMTNESYVDLNRTGTPLLEIVSEPDMENAFEARAYLKALRSIVQYLQISSCNMEEGAFRADTNISVRKKTAQELGTRCELKNINSFKFIGDAIEYEAERQILAVERGEKIIQQTRLWNTELRQSFAMRSKENLADYRYCTDPDLSLVVVDAAMVDAVRNTVTELPYDRYMRYKAQYNLSDYEADIITSEIELAQYFEQLMKIHPTKTATNWLLRDVLGLLKNEKINISECKITPELLAALVKMLEDGTINNKAALEVFAMVAQTGENPAALVEKHGLKQIGSADELEAIVKQVLVDNAALVEQYKAGNEKLAGFFVGACMKASKGNGNPKVFQDLLKKLM